MGEYIIILSPGQGKSNPVSSKIMIPNGYKLMGDIKKGDNALSVYSVNMIRVRSRAIFIHTTSYQF